MEYCYRVVTVGCVSIYFFKKKRKCQNHAAPMILQVCGFDKWNTLYILEIWNQVVVPHKMLTVYSFHVGKNGKREFQTCPIQRPVGRKTE